MISNHQANAPPRKLLDYTKQKRPDMVNRRTPWSERSSSSLVDTDLLGTKQEDQELSNTLWPTKGKSHTQSNDDNDEVRNEEELIEFLFKVPPKERRRSSASSLNSSRRDSILLAMNDLSESLPDVDLPEISKNMPSKKRRSIISEVIRRHNSC